MGFLVYGPTGLSDPSKQPDPTPPVGPTGLAITGLAASTGDSGQLTPKTSGNIATISVWFRIPADAVKAVNERDKDKRDQDVDVMYNVIPILMFGEQKTVTVPERAFTTVFCEYPPFYTIDNGNAPFRTLDYLTGATHEAPIQQSCIGVACFPEEDPHLFIHIQPDDSPVYTNLYYQAGPGFRCALGVHPPIPDWSDGTSAYNNFASDGAVTNDNVPFGTTVPAVKLDEWHHLLLSWSLNSKSSSSDATTSSTAGDFPSVNIITSSKLYCALDDVNLDGLKLPVTWVGMFDMDGGTGVDPNLICCNGVFGVGSGLWTPNTSHDPNFPPASQPTCSMTYNEIQTSPLWIPGCPSIKTQARGTITGNQHVMLAELQMWFGENKKLKTNILDTSEEANRRVFIDYQRNSSGRMVVDKDGTIHLKPVDPKEAVKLLGTPTILLHGNAKWQKGDNKGRGPDFLPAGTIKKYKPDPVIDQAPEPAPAPAPAPAPVAP